MVAFRTGRGVRMAPRVTVMGSYITDLAFRTQLLPAWGQTILGSGFLMGPGGKGSNQAVAAARLGAQVALISKLGRDGFAEVARRTWAGEEVDARYVFETDEAPTGAASIVVSETSGDNAIVVVPGSGLMLTAAEVDRARSAIAASAVFLTQLESPLEVVHHALRLARGARVGTILNPAPGLPLRDDVYPLCDYLTPNETEATTLIGKPVCDLAGARRAAGTLLERGAGAVVVTLGANGALVRTPTVEEHVSAVDAGPAVDATGAGDAFNGGFAIGLAEGLDVVAATRFGCAVAGISVTRLGTAPSMPHRAEVDALLARRG
jgi:ribokinase